MQRANISIAEKIPAKLLGRAFDADGLKAIRETIAVATPPLREEVARRVCQRLEWKSPGSHYQVMSAKVALLRLHRAGLIELPAPTRVNGGGGGWRERKIVLPEQKPLEAPLEALGGLALCRVSDAAQSALYNELIARYHYLGYTPMAGAQVRYLLRCEQGLLGAIGFGACAWKLAARDHFIGWEKQMIVREKALARGGAQRAFALELAFGAIVQFACILEQ